MPKIRKKSLNIIDSQNNELSNFSETPTKPIDTKMMATSILPPESPTGVLFPPVPSELLDRISYTIALLMQSSTKYGGSITPSASVSISTGNDLNVLPAAPEDYPIQDAMAMSKNSFACTQESLGFSSSKMADTPDQFYRLPIPSYDDDHTPKIHGSSTCSPASCCNPDSVPSSTLTDTSSTATDDGTEPTISSSTLDFLTSTHITNNTNSNDTKIADDNSNDNFDNNTNGSNINSIPQTTSPKRAKRSKSRRKAKVAAAAAALSPPPSPPCISSLADFPPLSISDSASTSSDCSSTFKLIAEDSPFDAEADKNIDITAKDTTYSTVASSVLTNNITTTIATNTNNNNTPTTTRSLGLSSCIRSSSSFDLPELALLLQELQYLTVKPPNVPEPIKDGEDISTILAALQNPLASAIEREWAQELRQLLHNWTTGRSEEVLSTLQNKMNDFSDYFTLKRRIFTDPGFTRTLESYDCHVEIPDDSLNSHDIFAALLCHPLSDSAEQCLFDEVFLLMAQHNYYLTKESLDRLTSKMTEAARHLTTNLYPRARADHYYASNQGHQSLYYEEEEEDSLEDSFLPDDYLFSLDLEPDTGYQDNNHTTPNPTFKHNNNSLNTTTCTTTVTTNNNNNNRNNNTRNNNNTTAVLSSRANKRAKKHRNVKGGCSKTPLSTSLAPKVPVVSEYVAPPVKVLSPLSPEATPFTPQQQSFSSSQGLQPSESSMSSPSLKSAVIELSSSPTSVALSFSPVTTSFSLQQQSPIDSPPIEKAQPEEVYSSSYDQNLMVPVALFPSPSQSSLVDDSRGGNGMTSTLNPTCHVSVSSPPPPATPEVAWWEGWKLPSVVSDYSLPSIISSPPPSATPEVAWWEGWKLPHVISDDFTPSEIISSPPPPATPMVAWWEGWKSLSYSFFLLLSFYYNDNLRFFPRADMISPPASFWSSWWEGWKTKPIHSPATSFSSSSSKLLPRAKHRMSLFPNKPSSLLVLSLLLNLLCFISLCDLYLSSTGISTTNLTNEPFSSAPGPAEWELGHPTLIPAALFRAQTDPPWSSPRLTLPISPMAYCLSLHPRKGPSKFTYPSYSFLLATIFFATIPPLFAPGVERVRLFDSPTLLYDPG